MPVIHKQTLIHAPVERCFDLALDPDLHTQSVAHTAERVVSRTGSGLLGLGDAVTFEAVHFGVRQRLTARIIRLERPRCFEDEQVDGPFQGFRHRHAFEAIPDGSDPGGTLMTDTFAYRAPLGPLGRLAEHTFLTRYLRRFLAERAAFLKRIAEETDTAGRSYRP